MGKNEDKLKNFRWTLPMERMLLEVLAEEASFRNKPTNTFKPVSILRAATSISNKFGVDCQPKFVENHLRTVRKTWNTICTIKRNGSGLGWDDSLKMITAPKEAYDEIIAAHPEHEKFLNKKIEMYDEMASVVGKDVATGSFTKDFDQTEIESTEVSSTNLNENVVEEVEKEKNASVSSSKPRSHKKRTRSSSHDDDDDNEIEKLSGQVAEVAKAIKELSKPQIDVNELYTEVMKVEGYDDDSLASVFDYFVENERQAIAFMVKKDSLRKLWITNFLKQK